MALSNQDIVKGVDMTGINPVNGADFNSLVDGAAPVSEGNGEGKGLTLLTKDTAVNTPNVPDSNVFQKWKRYLWIRIPFHTVVDKTPFIYAWNDNAPNDATLLRWVRLLADIATIEAIANEALADAVHATNVANTANATANAANVSATTSNTNSANALAQVTSATNAAANAVTQASTANGTANSALSIANSANASANNAITIANANKNISANFCKLSEVKDVGVNNANNVVGKNIRIINHIDYNPAPLVSLDTLTGLITILAAGTYKISGLICVHLEGATGTDPKSQVFLVKNDDNLNLIEGHSMYHAVATTGHLLDTILQFNGIVVLAAGTVIRIDNYFNKTNNSGLGLASNLNPNGAGHEVYAWIEIQKLT